MSSILALTTSTDGSLIAARTANSRVPVWNTATGKMMSRMSWHAPKNSELSFVPNSVRLCVSSWNGVGEYIDPTLPVVSYRRSDLIWSVNPAYYLSLSISDSGRWMASTIANTDDIGLPELAIFDREKQSNLYRSTGGKILSKVRYFQDDGLIFTLQQDGPSLWVWSRDPWELVQELQGHSAPITDVVMSADGQHLLTASLDGTAIIWDWASGRAVRQFDWGIGGLTAIAMAPDGLTWSVGGERGDVLTCDYE